MPTSESVHQTNKEIKEIKNNCNENDEPKEKKRKDRASEYGFSLPPDPIGECQQYTKNTVLIYTQNPNVDVNKWLQDCRRYQNPSYYSTLVERFDIDELGTNFPAEIYDPAPWIGMFLKLMPLNIESVS